MIFTVIGIFGIAWFLLFLWFIRCYDRGFNYLDDKWIRYFDRMKSTINRLERRIDMLEEKMEEMDETKREDGAETNQPENHWEEPIPSDEREWD